jgi:succinate-semialdehyde dehydrogenase/glutarate-semialdehyde dehydrogenase
MPDPFRSVDPATGATLHEYVEHTAVETERRVAAAAAAQHAWRATDLDQRAAALLRLAAVLRERRHELARLATSEMGKLLREAEAEVEKCALAVEFFARHGAAWLAAEPARGAAAIADVRIARVQHEPLGLVLAIMPWNFPYWQVLRCAVPALLAGNGVLVKHAPSVQGCAEALEAVCDAALPPGLCANLRVSVERLDGLCADRRVAALSLTGSTRAGRSAAAMAGRHLKPIVLELGGSDPLIVLADADLERAARAACTSRLINAGQSCIAAKRIVVESRVYDAFEARFGALYARLRCGPPLEASSDCGPLARADLRDELERQLAASLREGARLVCGGRRGAGAGWYFEPTLLADVTPSMTVFREETFGPLAVLVRARDAEHALELANDTPYGLAASLWTTPERGLELAARIEAGSVYVNEFARSDARLPFGGVKDSGYGRELGRLGLLQFTNAKTVWVAQ